MVDFFETEHKLTLDQIENVELKFGINFPDEYKSHLLKFNGGRCKPNKFSFNENGKTTNSILDWFLAIHDGKYDNLIRYYNRYKREEKRLPDPIFPIAHDPGGNLICMSEKDGKVYFWDHEKEVNYLVEDDDNYSNLFLISNSFEEFLDALH
ncbi:SMI1/KNR4 family protein [Puteibacter caeruleilacunae]|nr:SMI1/KNR4 family protein [Puteibacter caeruleilacunae]